MRVFFITRGNSPVNRGPEVISRLEPILEIVEIPQWLQQWPGKNTNLTHCIPFREALFRCVGCELLRRSCCVAERSRMGSRRVCGRSTCWQGLADSYSPLSRYLFNLLQPSGLTTNFSFRIVAPRVVLRTLYWPCCGPRACASWCRRGKTA